MAGSLVSVKSFWSSLSSTFSRRGLVFAVLNLVYFGSILVTALVAQFQTPQLPPAGELPLEVPGIFSLEAVGFPWLVVSIFVWNLVVSAFVVVTVVGVVFFALSMVTLVLRAVVWGTLLGQLSTPQFLAVLPTLLFEGEGYVLAAVVGVVLGLSWLKPSLVYGSEPTSRFEALKRAVREAARLYVVVALLLFLAALIEVATIVWLY